MGHEVAEEGKAGIKEALTEQVVYKKESKRCIDIPAVYETVCEQVLCKLESKRCINIPAEYTTEAYQMEACLTRTEMRQVNYDANGNL